MAIIAIYRPMNLKMWRQRETLTLQAASDRLGLAGARTYQRYESGETRASALLIESICEITGGAVTPQDMHETRLAWEREHLVERQMLRGEV